MRRIRSLQVSVDPSLDRVHNRSEMIARARQWAWSRAQSLPPTGYHTRVGTIAGPYGVPTLASNCLPSPVSITVQGDYFPDQSARLTIGALYCPGDDGSACTPSWGTLQLVNNVYGYLFDDQFDDTSGPDITVDTADTTTSNTNGWQFWAPPLCVPTGNKVRWSRSITSTDASGFGFYAVRDGVTVLYPDPRIVTGCKQTILDPIPSLPPVGTSITLTAEVLDSNDNVIDTIIGTMEIAP